MARIPKYQIRQLMAVDLHNPGVDEAPLKVGDSLLQSTSALARTLTEADARTRAMANDIQNSVIRGALNLRYAKEAQKQANLAAQKQQNRMNAETLATQAKTETANALRDSNSLAGKDPTADIQEIYSAKHEMVVKQFKDHNYRTQDGKPINQDGERQFDLLMSQNKEVNLNQAGKDQDVLNRGRAKANYLTAEAAAVNAAKSINNAAEFDRAFNPAVAHDGVPADLANAAYDAFGQGGEARLKTLANKIASTGIQSALDLQLSSALDKTKTKDNPNGSLPDALSLLVQQVSQADMYLQQPKVKDNLAESQITTANRNIAKLHNSLTKQMEAAVQGNLSDKMLQGSIAMHDGIKAAAAGDNLGAETQIQQLEAAAEQIAKSGVATPKTVQLYGHLAGSSRAISSAMAQVDAHKRAMNAQYRQALKAKQDEIYQSEASNIKRARVDEAKRMLPSFQNITGSSADYEAINEMRAALEDAGHSGALGFGDAAATKMDAYYGQLNAVLQKAHQVKRNNNGGAQFLQGIADTYRAFSQHVAPAPADVQARLNPGNESRLHNLINDVWSTQINNQVKMAKSNPLPGMFDPNGNITPAAYDALTKKLSVPFVDGFKTNYSKYYAPVDASGKELDRIEPVRLLDVSGQVLKDASTSAPPAYDKNLVPPPPPYTPMSQMTEGGNALAQPDLSSNTSPASSAPAVSDSNANDVPFVPESLSEPAPPAESEE